jgi:hypothetical protein
MIYLDQEKLDQFFKSVASGFTATPKEVLLFFVALAVILSFLIIFYLVQRRRMHRKLSSQSAERYAELIDQHKLSDAEVKLIEGLSEYLSADKQKYLLLTNQHLFNVCAGKLRAKRPVSESTLASARLKLGFRLAQSDEIPYSTFSSRIVNSTRQAVTVQHSEEIKQYQRRNHYRRKTHLSVQFRFIAESARDRIIGSLYRITDL